MFTRNSYRAVARAARPAAYKPSNITTRLQSTAPKENEQLWKRYIAKPAKYTAFGCGSIVFGISAFIVVSTTAAAQRDLLSI